MVKNYLKVAWRNLLKDKSSACINIGGLAVGMAVALLIEFWIYDELHFNKSFANYDRIAQIMQHQTSNGSISTFGGMPLPLGKELQVKYGDNFKYVVMASWKGDFIVSTESKSLSRQGIYMDIDAPRLFSLHMMEGTRDGLSDPNSILLSSSSALAFFGTEDPIHKLMKLGGRLDVKVTGVYEDLPSNTEFGGLDFIAPWELYLVSAPWIRNSETQWDNNSFQIYVQIADHAQFPGVDQKIVRAKNLRDAPEDKKYNAQLFLHPMRDWHLRSHWDNGKNAGGLIEYVRLFRIIGIFVLLLACINFMNLSTARSEKRAREVGIRKAIGSLRRQLIAQFYTESLLIVGFAFGLAILLAQVVLPWFDGVANKQIAIPWGSPGFWLAGAGFSLVTAFIAGSYPALYLSSFRPIKVLKGTLRLGRLASLPRKVLVVAQFSISLILIIGTVIVYKQIQYSKNRPIGYDKSGLIMFQMKSPEFYGKYGTIQSAVKNSGAVEEMAESSSPLTAVWSDNDGLSWPGKDPGIDGDFETIWVTHEFGKTVGWQFIRGRDFSQAFRTDSSAVVINEAAAKFMGIKNPVGTTIQWGADAQAKFFHVVGVIKDMLMESPYEPVRQTIYLLDYNNANWIVMKLNPHRSVTASLSAVESVFKQYIPGAPFDYKFVNSEFASKFGAEERIGKLASFFAALAIFISCLGLFGLSSFMAEQRTKEIGVRKVLGASSFDLWRLLSNEFLLLILLSLLISTPVAYHFMNNWLMEYPYRTPISAGIFGFSGLAVLLITLVTVSFQTIRAALSNPINCLRTE
jgi:putative ABC transport system permease protein